MPKIAGRDAITVKVHFSQRNGEYETEINWPDDRARNEKALTDALADLVAMRRAEEARGGG